MQRAAVGGFGVATTCVTLTLIAAGCTREPDAASTGDELVWDEDGRSDPFDFDDNTEAWARAVGMIIPRVAVDPPIGDPATCCDTCPSDDPAARGCMVTTLENPLCELRSDGSDHPLFHEPPVFDEDVVDTTNLGPLGTFDVGCTAFMVDEHLFLTAGHCINPTGGSGQPEPFADHANWDCSELAVLMRYRNTADPVLRDANSIVLRDQLLRCEEVIAHGEFRPQLLGGLPECDPNDPGVPPPPDCHPGNTADQWEDWALFTTEPRDLLGRAPLAISTELPEERSGTPPTPNLISIAYPLSMPQKIDNSVADIGNHRSWFEYFGDQNRKGSGAPLLDPSPELPISALGIARGLASAFTPGSEPDPMVSDGAGGMCIEEDVCAPDEVSETCVPLRAVGFEEMLRDTNVPQERLTLAMTGDFDDFDSGSRSDVVKLVARDAFGAPTANFELVVESAGGTTDRVDTGLPNFEGSNIVADMKRGDFDADGFEDVAVLANGFLRVFRGTSTGVVAAPGFAPIDDRYRRLVVADFNGDGFDDLQASFNPVDVYYGSVDGVTDGFRMSGFPSNRTNDGKYISVAGQGFSTIDIAEVALQIVAPATSDALHVEVFDGDLGDGFKDGDWRDDSGGTCFRLLADPMANGTGDGGLVTQEFSATFEDGGWTSLHSDGHDPDARCGASFCYVLRAFLAEGCAFPKDGTLNLINSFKVRANRNVHLGRVGIVDEGDVVVEENIHTAFFGADRLGVPISPFGRANNTRDVDYDGVFEFLVEVGSLGSSMTLIDADADFLDDSADGDGSFPGVAEGANDIIHYKLFDPDGVLVVENNDVSGNFDALAGALEVEERTVTFTDKPGFWRWRWEGVWTENNVHIWAPRSSPPQYRMYGAGTMPARLITTFALTREQWLERPDEIRRHLPIVLGTVGPGRAPHGSTVDVHNVEQATRILRGEGAPERPLNTPAFAELIAEFLAAELSVRRSEARSQPLSEARIYGRIRTVSEVLTAARDAAAERCGRGRCLSPAGRAARDESELEELTPFLRAINIGETTFQGVEPMPSPEEMAVPVRPVRPL